MVALSVIGAPRVPVRSALARSVHWRVSRAWSFRCVAGPRPDVVDRGDGRRGEWRTDERRPGSMQRRHRRRGG